MKPNQVWITDITYIRTWQGWLYLAVVIDLFARNVVGWPMKPTLSRELVLDALPMAVWRRKPAESVMVHSDQGSQYGSDEWQRFCRGNNLTPSMSRRGNCWDNAVAESFFSSLKKSESEREYIKPGTWPGRIYSITLKYSTTESDATVISVVLALRPSKRPHREDRNCLRNRGHSIHRVVLISLTRQVAMQPTLAVAQKLNSRDTDIV